MECDCGRRLEIEDFAVMVDGEDIEVRCECPRCRRKYYAFLNETDMVLDDGV